MKVGPAYNVDSYALCNYKLFANLSQSSASPKPRSIDPAPVVYRYIVDSHQIMVNNSFISGRYIIVLNLS